MSCKCQDAAACAQPMALLLEEWVNPAVPFAVLGLDHAGPLYCCDTPRKKYWVLLFTCGVVHAVHLELVDVLSTYDTVLAFWDLVARRSLPKVIYSDNAKGFVAAPDKILRQFGPLTPEWRFITPNSPWRGGWWERLARSVRSALRTQWVETAWRELSWRQLSMKLKPASIADPSPLFLTIRIKRSLWHHLISYCVMTAITWVKGPSHHPLRPQMMRIEDLTWDSLWSTSFGSSGVRSTSRDFHPGGVCLKDIFWGRVPWCSPRLIIGHVYSGHCASSHRFWRYRYKNQFTQVNW